jgi:hypothetical protein
VAAALEPYSRHADPRTTPPPLPTIPESLTEDELPVPTDQTRTDSRLRMPAVPVRPRARKAGCLGVVLLGVAIGIVVGRWV